MVSQAGRYVTGNVRPRMSTRVAETNHVSASKDGGSRDQGRRTVHVNATVAVGPTDETHRPLTAGTPGW